MFGFVRKKELDKHLKESFKRIKLHIEEVSKAELKNRDKIDKLEERLSKRIDDLLLKALDRVQVSNNVVKSKPSVRQVQEKQIIQSFRHTKKQLAKEKILELEDSMPIPMIKTKLMSELGISKASFYNYLKELDTEKRIQESIIKAKV